MGLIIKDQWLTLIGSLKALRLVGNLTHTHGWLAWASLCTSFRLSSHEVSQGVVILNLIFCWRKCLIRRENQVFLRGDCFRFLISWSDWSPMWIYWTLRTKSSWTELRLTRLNLWLSSCNHVLRAEYSTSSVGCLHLVWHSYLGLKLLLLLGMIKLLRLPERVLWSLNVNEGLTRLELETLLCLVFSCWRRSTWSHLQWSVNKCKLRLVRLLLGKSKIWIGVWVLNTLHLRLQLLLLSVSEFSINILVKVAWLHWRVDGCLGIERPILVITKCFKLMLLVD